MNIDKRGQQSIVVTVVGVIVAAYIIGLIAVAGFNNWDWANAVGLVSDFTVTVFGSLVSSVLNPNGQATDNFFVLKILIFLLVTIIVTGALDSIEFFSGSKSNKWLSFIIGIIVSIIGVRYLPETILGSLTAPYSALAATLWLALPFVALFMVGIKTKVRLASEALWMFYLVFLIYVMIKQASGEFWGVFIVFIVLDILMLFFGGKIRSFFFREKAEVEMAYLLGSMNVIERRKLRDEIKEYNKVLTDTSPLTDQLKLDKRAAQQRIDELTKLYGDLSQI